MYSGTIILKTKLTIGLSKFDKTCGYFLMRAKSAIRYMGNHLKLETKMAKSHRQFDFQSILTWGEQTSPPEFILLVAAIDRKVNKSYIYIYRPESIC